MHFYRKASVLQAKNVVLNPKVSVIRVVPLYHASFSPVCTVDCLLQQDIGFGDPTPPPVHQPPSFYAAAQAVSAFHSPQSGGGYPPPAGGGYPPPAGQQSVNGCHLFIYLAVPYLLLHI